MPAYRHRLPQLSDEVFLTDGGIETTLIFLEGLELPDFAAFHLLRDANGRAALDKYFRTHAAIAAQRGAGFVLESPTWRASPDWAEPLRLSLEALAEQLRTNAQAITVATFTNTIKAVVMYEKYYTPEQLETLKQRAETLGADRIQQAQADWQTLIAEVRAEMEKGTDPRSEHMQILAARWQALIDAFTGGNPEIRAALQKLYEGEGADQASHQMVDPDVMDYVAQAMNDERGRGRVGERET